MQTQMQQRPTVKIEHPLTRATPEIQQIFDEIDPLIADRADLVKLLETVPDGEIQAFLWGIIDTREFIATITGREFF